MGITNLAGTITRRVITPPWAALFLFFLLVEGVELSNYMCLKERIFFIIVISLEYLYENCFGTRNENSHKKKERTKKFLVSYKKFEHDSRILSTQRGYIHTPNQSSFSQENTQIKHQTWTLYGLEKGSSWNFQTLGNKAFNAFPFSKRKEERESPIFNWWDENLNRELDSTHPSITILE